MYKCVGVPLVDFIISYENEIIGLSETKLFHFHRKFKNGGVDGGGWGFQVNPLLIRHWRNCKRLHAMVLLLPVVRQ